MWRCDVAHVMWCHQIWPRPSTKSGTANITKCQQIMRLPDQLQSQIVAPATNRTTSTSLDVAPATASSPNFAPARKSHAPKSPNVTPATKSDTPTCHKKTFQRHQMLPLPRKMTDMAWYEPYMENVMRIARGNRRHLPTVMKNWHSEMKHERNLPKTGWSSIYIGRRFDHRTSRTRLFSEVILLCFEDAFYNTPRSGYLPKLHQILRKVTLQHHQILPLPRKVTLQHHQIPNDAPAAKRDIWTSPNSTACHAKSRYDVWHIW